MNHNILTKSIDSKLSQLRLIDDDLFAVAFDGRKEETGIILNTILGRNDIHVESVKTQYEIHNIEGRSVKLDVFATDELGKQFNIEIQRDAYYAHPKRARYHASMMDAYKV